MANATKNVHVFLEYLPKHNNRGWLFESPMILLSDMGCGHPINSFIPSAASVFQTFLLIIWFSSSEESFIGYSQVSKVSRNLGILKL